MAKTSVPPAAPEWTASSHEAGVHLALDRIEAAAWLLDQLTVGELGFLDDKHEVPCWNSEVSASGGELNETLRYLVIASISRAVQEIRRDLPSRDLQSKSQEAVA